MTFELRLIRRELEERSTVGELVSPTAFLCWTLEDAVRPKGVKIAGETAIPAGRYKLILSASPRFRHRTLPLLLGVPGFVGVRIHEGNGIEHTEGCILVGSAVAHERAGPRLIASSLALRGVMDVLTRAHRAGEELWIAVENATVTHAA